MADRVWSEKDLIRRANRRLAVLKHVEEVSGSVSATCRYYGISRTASTSGNAATKTKPRACGTAPAPRR